MTWTITEESRDGYTVSTDPARLDVDAMHAFLVGCYWSPGIPREVWIRVLGVVGFNVASGQGSYVRPSLIPRLTGRPVAAPAPSRGGVAPGPVARRVPAGDRARSATPRG